ncbi:LANO_0A04896g1_1 [Lachancea nothofagi CBS 11611]|uniref:LANO_0A04896g1_1 n=1 Tax=Lachancea nothofagi CBS 11611 TaxID=1266666 RepID=A0A1G4IR54_9SACH|nr:LANO_0A04896g1_1 [Lachancea nothofagi CBS 11611]
MLHNAEYADCKSNMDKLETQLLMDPFSANAATLISEYAVLVRVMVVCVTQFHRGLRLTWFKGGELKIDRQSGFPFAKEAADQVADVVRAVDFITTLEKRFKKAQTQMHSEFRAHLKDLQVEGYDKYRREVMEIHDRSTIPTDGETSSHHDATSPESKKHAVLSTNRKITSSLVRTSHMLRSSVLQSELNISELQDQTSSLNKLNDRFDSLTGVLTTSSKIVKVIQNSSGQERRQIYSGLSFLILCISWVLWRRVFKMPVKLALWIWFRFFRSILAFFGAIPKVQVGIGLQSTSSLMASSVIGTVATPSSTLTETVESMVTMVEDAVDDAFSRIRDEL